MALYHTYRPQTFSEVLGQDHIKTTLREQVKADNVAHAYLFSGPRGVGKTSTARILAKAVNAGVDKKGEVLDNDISKSITEGGTIDIIEIDAASHTGVDNVREQIIENAQFRPTTLDKKVFIIDEVHMLSTSAFNALLKVLEEPPAYVIFILATTEPHKLPATIISRCQRFDFRPIPYDILLPHLEKIAKDVGVTVSEDVLARIVYKSDGCGRDAVSLLDQVMSIGKMSITAEDVQMVLPVSNITAVHSFVAALAQKDQTTGLASIAEETANGAHMVQFGKDCIEYLRYLMIAKAGTDMKSVAPDLSESSLTELQALTKAVAYGDILALLDAAQARVREIPRTSIPQLPLEMLVIWWCQDTAITPTSAAPTQAPVAAPPALVAPKQDAAPKEVAPRVAAEVPLETTPEPAPEPIKAAPKAPPANGDVTKKWKQIIQQVEHLSPSLVFILKMASIESETEKNVKLGVGYSFHKDKLESAASKQIIDDAMQAVLGTIIPYTVVVTGETTPIAQKVDPALNELATAFGGKVV
jgi:DNA polymerase-3 subunit gamma/tau